MPLCGRCAINNDSLSVGGRSSHQLLLVRQIIVGGSVSVSIKGAGPPTLLLRKINYETAASRDMGPLLYLKALSY